MRYILKSIFIALIIIMFSSISGCGKNDTENSYDTKENAWIFACDSVKSNLKAPPTANFPWYDDSYITSLGDHKYIIESYVDAQNSFGAKLRNNFSVELEITGEYTYNIINIQIGR